MKHKVKALTLISLVTLSACQTSPMTKDPRFAEVEEPQATTLIETAAQPESTETSTTVAEAQKVTFDNLWDYIGQHQTLTHHSSATIEQFKKHYLKKPRYLVQRSNRAAPYLHYIVQELEKRNMPIELAFTPMVESNFDPLAHSVAQAAGMWQFMPRTARGFGIVIDEWYDGRRDIIVSTKAALDYYQYLNTLFDGDWLLSVAAFNVGQGNVLKAIKKNKAKGKATDFWSLDLPNETKRHIPKWIALSHIFMNQTQHQLTLPAIANEAHFMEVEVDAPANLMQLADLTLSSKEEFYRLNPAYNKLFIPKSYKTASLLIPIESVEGFQEKLSGLQVDPLIHTVSYTIVSGDNLSTIARKHKTSVAELIAINELKSDRLKIGQKLKLPSFAKLTESEHSFFATLSKNKKRRRYQLYTVKSGDSLWKIAKKYGVSTKELSKWNQLNSKKVLRIGQKLKVWPKVS